MRQVTPATPSPKSLMLLLTIFLAGYLTPARLTAQAPYTDYLGTANRLTHPQNLLMRLAGRCSTRYSRRTGPLVWGTEIKSWNGISQSQPLLQCKLTPPTCGVHEL